MKLWIDVEDLFEHAAHNRRPSGIQRLAFELQNSLEKIDAESVGFVRHQEQDKSFIAIPFANVEGLFLHMAGSSGEEQVTPPLPVPVIAPRPGFIQRHMAALPIRVQEPARRLRNKLAEASCALIDLVHAGWFEARGPMRQKVVSGNDPKTTSRIDNPANLNFEADATKGDWLVVIGSHWRRPIYQSIAETQCKRHGLRLAILVYDIISMRRPEWFEKDLCQAFVNWFDAMAAQADIIFAISHHTAHDIEHYAQQTGLALRHPVLPIPLGTGFGAMPAPNRTPRLPTRHSYVLIVSTIEARKNHLLAFRVWRELMDTMPRDQIPILVFAGRTGWLVRDFMQQLDNADWLNGKIIHIDSPSDAELAALYQDCLFTLFPSFYEGWGLPVTESLAYGTPCLASNRTSLPEAGGNLARYFNPDNLDEALAAVRNLIEHPEVLQTWREQILAEFKPIPWTDSANAILTALTRQIGSA